MLKRFEPAALPSPPPMPVPALVYCLVAGSISREKCTQSFCFFFRVLYHPRLILIVQILYMPPGTESDMKALQNGEELIETGLPSSMPPSFMR